MSLRKQLLRLAAITILTPVLFLLGCQSRLIYHPAGYRAEHETLLRRAKGVRIPFTTAQGTQTAFYIPPRSAAAPPQTIWLCFGGNAALALDWLHFTDLWEDDFAYLLVDYPGYGECAGKPDPGSIRESGRAVFAALAKHFQKPETDLRDRLAVLGHSLGCAAALMTAQDLDVRRGVLVSPFTSMTDMGRIVLGWPLCLLNRHRFDNRSTLSSLTTRQGARFQLFHGREDEVIPVAMGRELGAMVPGAVTFREFPEAHHNDILVLHQDEIGRSMRSLASPGA